MIQPPIRLETGKCDACAELPLRSTSQLNTAVRQKFNGLPDCTSCLMAVKQSYTLFTKRNIHLTGYLGRQTYTSGSHNKIQNCVFHDFQILIQISPLQTGIQMTCVQSLMMAVSYAPDRAHIRI